MSCVMQVQYDNKSSLLNSFILYELKVYYSSFIKKNYNMIQFSMSMPIPNCKQRSLARTFKLMDWTDINNCSYKINLPLKTTVSSLF